MALSPEQEWTLVACGMVAHADDVLEIGEWDHILRLLDGDLPESESQTWLDLLSDRRRLEERFAAMEPPLPHAREQLLESAWRMALADGEGSEVEALIHDRIAERFEVDAERVAELRDEWTASARERAEIVIGVAAILANIDGRMDSTEAAAFDSLLERMPFDVGRRVEIQAVLYDPPELDEVSGRLGALNMSQRQTVLADIAPLVQASHRGERERELFMKIAAAAAVAPGEAERLLGGA